MAVSHVIISVFSWSLRKTIKPLTGWGTSAPRIEAVVSGIRKFILIFQLESSVRTSSWLGTQVYCSLYLYITLPYQIKGFKSLRDIQYVSTTGCSFSNATLISQSLQLHALDCISHQTGIQQFTSVLEIICFIQCYQLNQVKEEDISGACSKCGVRCGRHKKCCWIT